MKLTDQGSFEITAEEMRVIRQGLFVTLHHGDSVIQHDLQTITGYDLDAFRQVLWAVDEINGHNDEIRRLLAAQVPELALLAAPELEQRSRRLGEVIDAAKRYGIDVPPMLRSAGGQASG